MKLLRDIGVILRKIESFKNNDENEMREYARITKELEKIKRSI